MMKAVKLTIGSLLLGAMLAVAGVAQPVNFAVDAQKFIQRDKEKDKEKPVERDKKDEGRDKKDDKTDMASTTAGPGASFSDFKIDASA